MEQDRCAGKGYIVVKYISHYIELHVLCWSLGKYMKGFLFAFWLSVSRPPVPRSDELRHLTSNSQIPTRVTPYFDSQTKGCPGCGKCFISVPLFAMCYFPHSHEIA
jgi:hypothetical protein